jgi:hypothetical protein
MNSAKSIPLPPLPPSPFLSLPLNYLLIIRLVGELKTAQSSMRTVTSYASPGYASIQAQRMYKAKKKKKKKRGN